MVIELLNLTSFLRFIKSNLSLEGGLCLPLAVFLFVFLFMLCLFLSRNFAVSKLNFMVLYVLV